jgi:hypothetical protein
VGAKHLQVYKISHYMATTTWQPSLQSKVCTPKKPQPFKHRISFCFVSGGARGTHSSAMRFQCNVINIYLHSKMSKLLTHVLSMNVIFFVCVCEIYFVLKGRTNYISFNGVVTGPGDFFLLPPEQKRTNDKTEETAENPISISFFFFPSPWPPLTN